MLKKVLALVLAGAMVLTSTAFASENPNAENDAPTSTGDVSGKITIANYSEFTPAGTYNAYKIFDVTYEDGSVSPTATTDLYSYTITDDTTKSGDWASLIIDLTATPDADGAYPTKLKDAEDNVITGIKFVPIPGLDVYDSATPPVLQKRTYQVISPTKDASNNDVVLSAPDFAKALYEQITNATDESPEGFVNGVADELDLGYWFVTTTNGSVCNLTTTHPDELIYDKNEIIVTDKSIVEEGAEVKNNNAAIGNVIQFQVDTKVPSMVGYDHYYFIVKDTFSKGLTLVDAKDAASKTDSPYYAGETDTTDKYYHKNYIKVELAAGDPAGTHPAKELTRVYLGDDGEYYVDSALTKKITTTTRDTDGNITARTITTGDDYAGFELDDDLNLKYCYYVKVTEASADNTTVHTLAGNYDPQVGNDSEDRTDTINKGETRMEIVFVDMIQYLDQTNGTTTNTNENYDDTTQEGTLGSADTSVGYTGSNIKITYFGEVDEDAIVSDAGNPNTSKVTYSNDPTNTGAGAGTPDEPDDDTPTGDSPESKTNTFVTGLKLTKVDSADNTKKLAGAQFELKGTANVDTVIQNGVRYEPSTYTLKKIPATATTAAAPEDGESIDSTSGIVYAKEEWADGDASETYYKLKDGTYTTTAPTATGINPDLYEDGTGATTYKKVKYTWVVLTGYDENGNALSENNTHIANSGDDGVISFAGLKAGNYTLTELIAPDGYNMLSGDITITITEKYLDDSNAEITADNVDKVTAAKCEWTATISGPGITATTLSLEGTTAEEQNYSQDVLKLFQFEVSNAQGRLLPETGGIGTTIFYAGGAILVLLAGVLLVSKRRYA